MDRHADAVRDAVRRALAEDLGDLDLSLQADVTSRLALPEAGRGRARMLAKQAGSLAGMECATVAFSMLDPECRIERLAADGERVAPGQLVLEVEGLMRALLIAERTALNFVQRLSGVATTTRAFVEAVAGTGARILDTRKTTPGMRLLEKQAVLAGGGCNHRIGLYDQVLLKENHFGFAAPAPYEDVVAHCVAGQDRPVVAEARSIDEGLAAVRGGAAIVLLDNFAPGEPLRAAVVALRAAARELGREIEIEASGGVDLRTVRAFAESGVDRISVGALTHSAVAVDFSLLVEGVRA
ncbi:MAG: carboxylating nicotinate-nucleotide diphosphorylase [Planctomycetes bacterium]|nr:carboxylating nicotinate-nucleotide diphosphorylase [Planctomycetota bacterium]MCB9883873.1 carboxylating nicotinate-nucleotide diphosphorylase [Planctomycetota bacterium]